jgi:hypothetical protein
MISRKVRMEELNRVMSAFTAISSYANSAGTLLSGLNYSTLFLLGILLALASTVIVLPVREGTSGSVKGGLERQEVLETKQRPYMRVFAVSGALNGVSQGLVVPFMPVVFKEYFGLSNAEIGRIYFVVGVLAATLMLFLSSRLSEAMGVGRFIFVSRAVSALSALFIPYSKRGGDRDSPIRRLHDFQGLVPAEPAGPNSSRYRGKETGDCLRAQPGGQASAILSCEPRGWLLNPVKPSRPVPHRADSHGGRFVALLQVLR